MNRLFKSFTHAGVSDNHPEYLQKRILLSNWIALIIITFVAIPFTIISALYFPPLISIPIAGVVVLLLCPFLNRLGFVVLSRMTVGYVPLALASIYHASLAMTGEPPVAGLYMIELSFALTPFLVFDTREKAYLYISGVYVLLIILSFRLLNAWIEIELDTDIIRTGFLSDVSVIVAVLTGLGSVLILMQQSRRSEDKSELLLAEAQESQQQAAASEQTMKENLEQLKVAQEEEKKRQWANEGLTEVSRLVRDHEDISELADQILSYTVKFIKANQGSLFVVNRSEENEYIDLLATYAYDRKKYQEKRVKVGQGLVGQVYLEKKYIYFKKIPQHYVSITSGLGEAPPTVLIIMPFLVNEEVEGILELASFHPLAPHEVDFLEKLGESVAATIRNTRINEKTRTLLIETQQQAEEMRATEEEMRQNMEELTATQEEMQRKEQEYLEKIAAMDQQLAASGK